MILHPSPPILTRILIFLSFVVVFAFVACSDDTDGDGGEDDVGISDVGDSGDINDVGGSGDANDVGDSGDINDVGDSGDVDTADIADTGDTGDTEVDPEQSCGAICDRLESCDAGLDECVSTCLLTIEDWGDGAIESFEACHLEDHDCQELRESANAAQMCYDELELPEERRVRCETFVDQAEDCTDDTFAVDELWNECLRLGRTGGEDDWAQTDVCVVEEPVNCSELSDCLNEVFELDPGL